MCIRDRSYPSEQSRADRIWKPEARRPSVRGSGGSRRSNIHRPAARGTERPPSWSPSFPDISPVSYTHLDVYKRQQQAYTAYQQQPYGQVPQVQTAPPAKGPATTSLVCGIIAIVLGCLVPIAGIILGIIAVSYTHLATTTM